MPLHPHVTEWISRDNKPLTNLSIVAWCMRRILTTLCGYGAYMQCLQQLENRLQLQHMYEIVMHTRLK